MGRSLDMCEGFGLNSYCTAMLRISQTMTVVYEPYKDGVYNDGLFGTYRRDRELTCSRSSLLSSGRLLEE
jgi:hypothetical protein